MPATSLAKITCLLVDDHPTRCQGMRLLVEAGDSIDVVAEEASGDQALKAMAALRPDVALVNAALTPALNGFDTTEGARAQQLPTRIVIYSDNISAGHVRRAFASGAYGYVSKMSPYSTVLAALQAVAAGKQYLDPSAAAELLGPTVTTLSIRELDVLELLASGMQNAGIAFDLGVSSETVKSHVSHLFSKLDVQTRAGAVAQGFRTGILE